MMTATQDQLAALAALVGINDKTHPHLFCHHLGEGMKLVHEWLPALDTDAGDDVFLAPFMRWLASEDFQPKVIGGTVWFEATVEGLDSWQSVEEKHMTLALVRACQAAGVPEICEIFGRGDHDAR